MPQRKNVEPMTTGPHTFPTTDSCRILSCIITPCNVDTPNCITCDTSRHIHQLSCRDAEQDYLPHYYPSQGFEPAFAPSLYFVVRHAVNGRCSYGNTRPAADQRTGHSVCNRISAACRPQKLALRVSFRLVAEQSGARWHFSKP